jgi:hypothetical protein
MGAHHLLVSAGGLGADDGDLGANHERFVLSKCGACWRFALSG